MKILNSKLDLQLFYHQASEARQKAILLDYDGTLAPFHVNPEKAFPYPGVREMLKKVMQAPDVRTVFISGRCIRDLEALLEFDVKPELRGSHGLERLKSDGSYEVASMDEMAVQGLVMADEWIETTDYLNRCEKKPGCLAVRWRGLNERKISEMKSQVMETFSRIAEDWKLSLEEFDGGLELRAPVRNKGDAVKTVLYEMGPDVVAAYLGDDVTDEDAFKAIKGRGLAVLVRNALRPTAADIWIKPPEELLNFLSNWLPRGGK
ncbi:MAG: trehalose-phosphatase [Desulfobacterales bacterium]|nr:trehalose-phosphatase [Desulfobacterales bacterium]